MLATMGALKHSGPLLGYNNNVPYKGQVFHVQTEDSGSKRPHVITHLFADGGRIVKTTKTSYAHYLDSDNLTDRVRALMREQHKGMVIALRDGNLDALIDEGRAEIEEKTAPEDKPVEVAAAPDKPNDALALLERAAAVDDREFYREMEQLVPPSQPPPPPRTTPSSDHSAGAYSFVGRSTGPPRKSEPPPRISPLPPSSPGRALPPRRMRSTKPPTEEDGMDEAPPAIDVAGARRRTRRTRDGPPESEDRPTSVYQRGSTSQRTDPDLKGARDHAAAASQFGARFIGSSRFDELVVTFFGKRRSN